MTERSSILFQDQMDQEPLRGKYDENMDILRVYLGQDDPVKYVRNLVAKREALQEAQTKLAIAQRRLLLAAQRKARLNARAGKAKRVTNKIDSLLKVCASEVYDTRRDAAARLRESREALKKLSDHYITRISEQILSIQRLQLFLTLRPRHESTIITLLNLKKSCQTKLDALNAVTQQSSSSEEDD